MSLESPKSKHMTENKKKTLIELLQNDEQLRNGKFTNNFTFAESRKRWIHISDTLNSIPGARKDWLYWKRTWQDLKKNVKKKSSDLKKYTMGTGGGPPPKDLNTNDENVLQLIDLNSLEGSSLIEESVVWDEHDYINLNNPATSSSVSIMDTFKQSKNLNTETTKKRKAPSKFDEALQNSNRISDILENKNKKKDDYYERKLHLMERDVIAKERIAAALEKLSNP
ncbi:unnamed protein product [Psylliodes chrysocephalus]|uniref:Regulatory protein zeste n=1 Tax=Psylliodes chrysocephalus TaxID=3402493 RepID=A0A9P0CSW2_9CUCU|nr:unnamed protein product [Psylliodes chrysocephala]